MWVYSLRTKFIFTIGFGIGVALAILVSLTENLFDENAVCNTKVPRSLEKHNHEPFGNLARRRNEEEPHENVVFGNWIRENWLLEPDKPTYQNWQKRQNAKISSIDMDRQMYGLQFDVKPEKQRARESDWLKSKIHVTCVIFVDKLRLAESIKNTWGSRCNRIYFFGQQVQDSGVPVIKFGIKLTSSWQLLCESMNYVWKDTVDSTGTNDGDKTMEWVIFVKDDTMVIPENLRYIVAPLDFNQGHYLGHPIILWGQAYNVAQAGYVLSKGAFEKIIDMFDTQQKCASGGKYWKKEDYYLGKHLTAIGIHPSDTRDEELRGTFHGYSLQILLWGIARPGSYWTRALYPPGPHCCSTRSVTFSAGEPDKMHTLNYMLYHLNVYKHGGIYGNRPASTSVPDEEVWKSVLREEFNITDLDEISSERYYEIWRERYSEPEQFIMQNYKNMPDVLSSLLTAYETEKKYGGAGAGVESPHL